MNQGKWNQPIQLQLHGDKEKAMGLIGFAQKKLGELAHAMSFNGLKQDQRSFRFDDGPVVDVKIVWGQAFANVFWPVPIPPVIPKTVWQAYEEGRSVTFGPGNIYLVLACGIGQGDDVYGYLGRNPAYQTITILNANTLEPWRPDEISENEWDRIKGTYYPVLRKNTKDEEPVKMMWQRGSSITRVTTTRIDIVRAWDGSVQYSHEWDVHGSYGNNSRSYAIYSYTNPALRKTFTENQASCYSWDERFTFYGNLGSTSGVAGLSFYFMPKTTETHPVFKFFRKARPIGRHGPAFTPAGNQPITFTRYQNDPRLYAYSQAVTAYPSSGSSIEIEPLAPIGIAPDYAYVEALRMCPAVTGYFKSLNANVITGLRCRNSDRSMYSMFEPGSIEFRSCIMGGTVVIPTLDPPAITGMWTSDGWLTGAASCRRYDVKEEIFAYAADSRVERVYEKEAMNEEGLSYAILGTTLSSHPDSYVLPPWSDGSFSFGEVYSRINTRVRYRIEPRVDGELYDFGPNLYPDEVINNMPLQSIWESHIYHSIARVNALLPFPDSSRYPKLFYHCFGPDQSGDYCPSERSGKNSAGIYFMHLPGEGPSEQEFPPTETETIITN